MNKSLKQLTEMTYTDFLTEDISLSIEKFEQLKSIIIDKIKPCINIETYVSKDILPWDSKFGGNPYMLKSDIYPIDKDGIPMILVAQINYAQMPKLENFPDSGMLQFFISPSEKYDYGVDFNGNNLEQYSWKLIYREKIEKNFELLINDFSFLNFIEQYEYNPSPVEKEVKMKFEYSYSLPSFGNVLADDIFEKFGNSISECYADMINEFVKTYIHSIGGYNEFTQYDLREDNKTPYNTNLLKIDSDDYIMWGDSGIGNLMISKEDLINKNFKNVLFSWDCC